jgi:ABC-type uncharacterized transport system auxiliary subunit
MLSCPHFLWGEPMGRKIWLIAIALTFLAACDDSKPKAVVYSLYRNSPTVVGTISGVDARIRVATFDAAEGEDYNRKNCELVRDLFANQSLVTVRYWCELGKFTQ